MDDSKSKSFEQLVNDKCLSLTNQLKSQNCSEDLIQNRVNRYRKFLIDFQKKSVANTCVPQSGVSSDVCASDASPQGKKGALPKTPDEATGGKSCRTSSPLRGEGPSTSSRADGGDSGISSDRKSPNGFLSRALSHDSVSPPSPDQRKLREEEATGLASSQTPAAIAKEGHDSMRRSRRRASSLSSQSEGSEVSRSKSRSRSKSQRRHNRKRRRRSGGKERKSHKRRKHHRSRRRSSRSPSYSRYRSRSRSRSRRGRRRRHKRSHSRTSSFYSSLSRSPSIRRRPGSPSHLDRRRITRYAVRSPPRTGAGLGSWQRPLGCHPMGSRISSVPWRR